MTIIHNPAFEFQVRAALMPLLPPFLSVDPSMDIRLRGSIVHTYQGMTEPTLGIHRMMWDNGLVADVNPADQDSVKKLVNGMADRVTAIHGKGRVKR